MEARRPLHVASGLAVLAVLLLPAAGAQVALPEAPATPLYAYHTYTTLTQDLERLAAAHPGLAQLTSLGKSRAGLDLWSLEIGPLGDPTRDRLPGFYLDGGHHGNEALGIEAAYLFAKDLLEAYDTDPEAKALVDERRIYVTPLVNPDGKTLNSRQNGALVNLNRNYPFHWDERGTGPAGTGNYAGPSAGSEPETQANMRLLRERGIDVYVTLHTGSYDIVRPFGHAPDEPVPDEDVYQRLFAWAEDATGLTARHPGGSGESLCWAYGALGIFSILQEVLEFDVRPGGTPQLLLGPATEAEVRAVLEPHFQVMRHLLAEAGRWGARLDGALVDARGDRATLVLRNDGLGAARNITWVATGLEPLAPMPTVLAAGEEAGIPVRVDAPSHVRLAYERLAVVPEEDPARGLAALDVALELHTTGLEVKAAPGWGLVPLALAGAAVAAARRRAGARR